MDAFRAFISHEAFDRVVLRTADHAPGATDRTLFARLSAEGVLVAVARRHVASVTRMRGRDLAQHFGGRKSDLDAAATALCPGAGNAASAATKALLG